MRRRLWCVKCRPYAPHYEVDHSGVSRKWETADPDLAAAKALGIPGSEPEFSRWQEPAGPDAKPGEALWYIITKEQDYIPEREGSSDPWRGSWMQARSIVLPEDGERIGFYGFAEVRDA